MRYWLSLTLICAFMLVGCGDSPEVQLEQARLALERGKPDLAVQLASQVLAVDPENQDANEVYVRGLVRLDRLDDARNRLNRMVEARGDDSEIRELMLQWCLQKLLQTSSHSEYRNRADLQQEYTEAYEGAQEQIAWLIGRDETRANAHFQRARVLEIDALRITQELEAREHELRTLRVRSGSDDVDQLEAIIAELRQTQQERRREAMANLRETLAREPGHTAAGMMRIQLLRRSNNWDEIWEYATEFSRRSNANAELASNLVDALMIIPRAARQADERLAKSWDVLKAVEEKQQDTIAWLLAGGRLHLEARENDKAEVVLRKALEKEPRNRQGRYLLAHTLHITDRNKEAREILTDLSTQWRVVPVLTLYSQVLIEDDELELARGVLRDVLQADATDERARALLNRIMVMGGRLQEARGEIDNYYRNNPANPNAIRSKLQYDLAQDDRASVAQVLENTAKLQPLTEEHLRLLVSGYDQLQQFNQSLEYARTLVRRAPDNIENHLMVARALMALDREPEARQMLVGLRDRFPQSASADQLLAELFIQREKFDAAADLLEKITINEPRNTRARQLYAQALISLSMLDEAEAQLNAVLEIAPSDAIAHKQMARIATLQGRTDKIAQHLSQIEESQLSTARDPAMIAQIRMYQGDYTGAIEVATTAIGQGNRDPFLRVLLIRTHMQRREYREAETHLKELIRHRPNDPAVYALATRFYLSTEEAGGAAAALRTLQEFQTLNEPLSRVAQASIYAAVGELDRAIEILQPIYPALVRRGDALAFPVANSLSAIYLRKRDLDNAISIYDPIREHEDYKHRIALRRIVLESGRDGKERTIDKLIALANDLPPEERRVRLSIMNRLNELERLDLAMAMIDRSLRDDPHDLQMLRLKAQSLLAQNDHRRAIPVLEASIKEAPENVQLRLILANSHMQLLDFPTAEKVLRQMKEIDSGAHIIGLAELGNLFVSLGLDRQAATTFRELEQVGRPRDPRIIYAIGQAYARMNMDDLATDRLGQIPPHAAQYAPAQFLIARIEQRSGLTDPARQRLTTLMRDNRLAGAAAAQMFNLNLDVQNNQELIEWSEQAINLPRLSPEGRLRWLRIRSYAEANRKEWKQVQRTLDSALQLVKEDNEQAQLRLMQAVLNAHQGLNAEARRVQNQVKLADYGQVGTMLSVALDLPPVPYTGNNTLINFIEHMRRGEVDKARALVETLPPRKTLYRADLRQLLGRSDAGSDRMKEQFRRLAIAQAAIDMGVAQVASDICEKLAAEIPHNPVVYSLWIDAEMRRGRTTEPILGKVRQGLPRSDLALFLQARSASELKEYTRAADTLAQLLEREPTNVHIRYDLTNMLNRAGRIDESITLLQRIWDSQADPYRIPGGNDLAYLLAVHHPDRLNEAHQIIRTVVERMPNHGAVRDTMGWIEHLRGNHELAIDHMRYAVATLKDQAVVHYHMGEVYMALGNTAWARYHLDQAAASEEDIPEVKRARARLQALTSR